MSTTSTSGEPRLSRVGRGLVVSVALAAAMTLNGLSGAAPALAQTQTQDHAPMIATQADPDVCLYRHDGAQQEYRVGRSKPSWMPQWIWDAIHGDDVYYPDGADPCYPGLPDDPDPDDPNDPDWLPPEDDPTWEPEPPGGEEPEQPAPEDPLPDEPEGKDPQQPAPEEPQPEEPQPEEPQPEEPQPEEPQPEEPQPGPEAPNPNPKRGNIAALLATLETRPIDTRGRYRRDAFGKGWGDPDGNHCNTRNDILARDLRNVKKRGHCKVLSGILHGPYTNMVIHFTAGRHTSSEVQIDHVVAVQDAWKTGAQNLDKEQRIYFYNDPLNLLAVDGPTNTHKGSKNAAEWLPPNEQFHCEYVGRQIAVKARYHLWVTQDERNAMTRVLNHCPTDMRVEGNTIVGATAAQ